MTCHKTNIIFFFLFLQKNEVTGHLRNIFDIYLYHLVDPRGELINDRSYGSLGTVVCPYINTAGQIHQKTSKRDKTCLVFIYVHVNILPEFFFGITIQ